MAAAVANVAVAFVVRFTMVVAPISRASRELSSPWGFSGHVLAVGIQKALYSLGKLMSSSRLKTLLALCNLETMPCAES